MPATKKILHKWWTADVAIAAVEVVAVAAAVAAAVDVVAVATAVDVVAVAVDVDAVAAVYKTSPSARKQGERRKIKIVVSAQEKNKLPLKKIHPMGLFLYLPLLSLPLTPFSLPL